MTQVLVDAIAVTVGDRVNRVVEIAGGDINRAFRAELSGGRSVFVKHRADATRGMYLGEAHGLAWLADAGAVRVPRVVGVRDEAPRLLALEWIERGTPGPDHDELLGVGLARLHRSGAPTFGLDRDNLIATLPQPNTPTDAWPEFWASRRLEPLVRRALDARLLDPADLPAWERLWRRLPELCGPTEDPARLHGDLWGGNAIVDEHGAPVLIDPAVYGGHREVDLAMMRLFGGFSARVFAAYDEVAPLADGHEDRVPLYQLGPLLVHLILFGGSYRASVERALGHYA